MTDGHNAPNVVILDKFRPDPRSEAQKIDDALSAQQRDADMELAAQHVEKMEKEPVDEATVEADIFVRNIIKEIRTRMLGSSLQIDHPNMWAIEALISEMIEVEVRKRNEEVARDLMLADDEKFDPSVFDPALYSDVVQDPDAGKSWLDLIHDDDK